MISYLRKKVKA